MKQEPKSILWCLLAFLVATFGLIAAAVLLLQPTDFSTGFVIGVGGAVVGHFTAEAVYRGRSYEEWK